MASKEKVVRTMTLIIKRADWRRKGRREEYYERRTRVTRTKMVIICSEQTWHHVLHGFGHGYIRSLNYLVQTVQ